jgi:hypothetical protein
MAPGLGELDGDSSRSSFARRYGETGVCYGVITGLAGDDGVS